MKLTTLDEDLKIHQKLEDEPNDVGGLSAQELKEKFDQAGLTIQKYLNEVHLPEEEQAVAEALTQAKKYTDLKVVAVGAGDMASAVYDTQKRRQDVYEYANQKAKEAMADTSKLGYVCAGKCDVDIINGVLNDISFQSLFDPKGLWSETEQVFIAPKGAVGMILTATVRWNRMGSKAMCYLEATVNGVVQASQQGPVLTASYYERTVMLPVAVQAGDKVGVILRAVNYSSDNAHIQLQDLRAEAIM